MNQPDPYLVPPHSPVQVPTPIVAPEITVSKTEQYVCSQLQNFFENNSDKLIDQVTTAISTKLNDKKIDDYLIQMFGILTKKINENGSNLNNTITSQIEESVKKAFDTSITKAFGTSINELEQKISNIQNSQQKSEAIGGSNSGLKNTKSRKTKTIRKVQKKLRTVRKSKKIINL